MKTDGPPKMLPGGHEEPGGVLGLGILGSILLINSVLLAGWATLQMTVWLGQVLEGTVTKLLRE